MRFGVAYACVLLHMWRLANLEARIAVRSHMHAFSHTSYHQRKLGSSYGQIEWWWRVVWNFTLHNNTSQKNWIELTLMKGGMWRMHAFSHASYHIISPTGIHSTDTQQHRDATHTYTRTYIHAHRCMYMSRYVAYLLHPFIVFFIHIYDSLRWDPGKSL